ncbi:MAG: hypothetical protein ACNA7E_07365 [Wenzhouxiangellaceae bacterium]
MQLVIDFAQGLFDARQTFRKPVNLPFELRQPFRPRLSLRIRHPETTRCQRECGQSDQQRKPGSQHSTATPRGLDAGVFLALPCLGRLGHSFILFGCLAGFAHLPASAVLVLSDLNIRTFGASCAAVCHGSVATA